MVRILTLMGLAAALTCSAGAQTPAFPFTYYIHDTTGTVADFPLPSSYQFAATALGNSTHIVVKAINTSGAPAFMGTVFVASSTASTTQDPNFTVTGLFASSTVAAGGSLLFQVNFTPTVTGPIAAYLETSYEVQNNCISVPGPTCYSNVTSSATLTGTATQPQLVLSYSQNSTTTILQPSATPLNFGNVSVSASNAITFTLANQSTLTINVPSISVPAPTVFSSNPFALDTSKLPATLAAGASANFTVTFAPGQTGVVVTSLVVGSNSYPIQGAGIIIADIDALQISYVDSTGVRGLPQAATPIGFDQVVPGAGGTSALVFTVMNPSTSYNSVTVSAVTISGAAFTMSAITGAATFPVSLAPGASFGFTITFTAATSGTYTGSLAIGTRVFSLSGLAVKSPLASLSLAVSPSPLTSQQQASVTVNLPSAATLSLSGTIALSFAPSLLGVTDDPAILFLAVSTRTLPISVASGAVSATYNGQSSIYFQTGTTAGTITFAVTFPNTPTYTQSFTITPSVAQITSATAVASSPNLVVSINGYDNTYSAGELNFTFYDTSGKAYPAIAYNASGSFQSLFLGSGNTTGGAFVLQATFPVTGDITKVGSVLVGLTNSAGQATTTQTITQ